METRSALLALILALALLAISGSDALIFDGYCDALTGECGSLYDPIGFVDDVSADVEMKRRMLLAPLSVRYISYGALSKDRVPCSRAGVSYYNCRGSGPVNPYHRGCSQITRCLRDIH